jgi:dihydrodipicolinate synthase/N-acetylneuraminate lyase
MRRARHQRAPFRFLNHEEFAALSQSERIAYLELAIEAVKGASPQETVPSGRSHPAHETRVPALARATY